MKRKSKVKVNLNNFSNNYNTNTNNCNKYYDDSVDDDNEKIMIIQGNITMNAKMANNIKI